MPESLDNFVELVMLPTGKDKEKGNNEHFVFPEIEDLDVSNNPKFVVHTELDGEGELEKAIKASVEYGCDHGISFYAGHKWFTGTLSSIALLWPTVISNHFDVVVNYFPNLNQRLVEASQYVNEVAGGKVQSVFDFAVACTPMIVAGAIGFTSCSL